MIYVPAGTTKFELVFDLPITTNIRPSGLTTVHRGPILYAFESFKQPGGDAPHRNLRYAIDPATLAPSTVRPRRVFFEPQASYPLSVAVCPISKIDKDTRGRVAWEWERGVFPELGPGPVRCIGPVRNLTLNSYTSSTFAYAAVKEFPTFSLAELEGPSFEYGL